MDDFLPHLPAAEPFIDQFSIPGRWRLLLLGAAFRRPQAASGSEPRRVTRASKPLQSRKGFPFSPFAFSLYSFQALRDRSIFLRTVFQASLVRKESRQRRIMRSNIS